MNSKWTENRFKNYTENIQGNIAKLSRETWSVFVLHWTKPEWLRCSPKVGWLPSESSNRRRGTKRWPNERPKWGLWDSEALHGRSNDVSHLLTAVHPYRAKARRHSERDGPWPFLGHLVNNGRSASSRSTCIRAKAPCLVPWKPPLATVKNRSVKLGVMFASSDGTGLPCEQGSTHARRGRWMVQAWL